MTRELFRDGDRLGDYEIRGRLRAGGMATLFLAQRHGAAGVSRPVVIKVIHPHLAEDELAVRMFIDEARISAHIRHSNVVYVEKLGEHDGVYYIVMEYVEGCSLQQLLHAWSAEGRKLTVATAVNIAMEAAAGLHAAHETAGADGAPLGVVHRDVSPSNVLLASDGRVKLIDFGIAKARDRLAATRSGSQLKGKLRYMSPEQAWGRAIDRRTDVYALGICLWELLTCRQLFRGSHDLAVLELVRNPTIPPPSKLNREVPAALDAVVLRATARRAEDRHQTALELRRDLMAAVPGAIAIPPELLAELVRHVCIPDRAATIGTGTSTFEDGTDFSSAASGSPGVVVEVRRRAWSRVAALAGVAAVCAVGIAIATARGSNDDAARAPTPPAILDLGMALLAPDAGTAPTANPAEPTIAAPTSDKPSPTIAAPADREPSPTIAAPANGEPPRAIAAPAHSESPRAIAAPADREPSPTIAAPANGEPPRAIAAPADREPSPTIAAPDDRKPARRPQAPDRRRVTAVEVDGAVLADEPTPRDDTARSRAKPARPGKPAKPTSDAVRVDDAVLAQ